MMFNIERDEVVAYAANLNRRYRRRRIGERETPEQVEAADFAFLRATSTFALGLLIAARVIDPVGVAERGLELTAQIEERAVAEGARAVILKERP